MESWLVIAIIMTIFVCGIKNLEQVPNGSQKFLELTDYDEEYDSRP